MTLIHGYVALADLPAVPAVYDPDVRWNGFLCPRLSREAVDALFAALDAAEPGTYTHKFNADGALAVRETDDPDGAKTYYPDAAGRYDLGSHSWCWHAAEDPHAAGIVADLARQSAFYAANDRTVPAGPDEPDDEGPRILALADADDLLTTINESALRAILRIALTDLLTMTPAEAEAIDLSEPYRLILADDCSRLILATGATT